MLPNRTDRPPALVTQNTPQNATEEQTRLLKVQDAATNDGGISVRQAKVFQAWYPHNIEQQKVINIHKIAQGSYDHGQGEQWTE
jgi:hypothetical protein